MGWLVRWHIQFTQNQLSGGGRHGAFQVNSRAENKFMVHATRLHLHRTGRCCVVQVTKSLFRHYLIDILPPLYYISTPYRNGLEYIFQNWVHIFGNKSVTWNLYGILFCAAQTLRSARVNHPVLFFQVLYDGTLKFPRGSKGAKTSTLPPFARPQAHQSREYRPSTSNLTHRRKYRENGSAGASFPSHQKYGHSDASALQTT